MKKKDLTFIIGFTLLMGILWIAGELVMGLWIAVVPAVRMAWRIGIVAVSLIVCVWHSMIEDESEKKTPQEQKYERKTKKKR